MATRIVRITMDADDGRQRWTPTMAGPDDPRHIGALLDAVRNETVTHIFVTHTHRDHSPGVPAIKAATGAIVYAEGPHRAANAPYIVKTPFLCDFAEAALASSVRIEHAIIPVCQFDAAAASRAHVQEQTTGSADRIRKVPGGLWDTDKAADPAEAHCSKPS